MTRESLIQLDGLLGAFAKQVGPPMVAAVVRMVQSWATEAWRAMPNS